MSVLSPPRAARTAVAVLGLGALTLASGLAASWTAALGTGSLVPYLGLVALAVGLPLLLDLRRGLDLFAPFPFAAWSYFAPVLVVGSAFLALGLVPFPFQGLVPDTNRVTALALVYVSAGLGGLALGCRSGRAGEIGRRLGARIAAFGPGAERPAFARRIASWALVGLGMAASYGAFRSGLIGYQRAEALAPSASTFFFLSLLMPLGHFLFWFDRFSTPKTERRALDLALPVVVALWSMVVFGNRGSLLACYLVAALAYRLATGRLGLRRSLVVWALSFVFVFLGMLWGTTFRALKGKETAVVREPVPHPSAPVPETAPEAAPDAVPRPSASTARPRPRVVDGEASNRLHSAPSEPARVDSTAVQVATTRQAVRELGGGGLPSRVAGAVAAFGARLEIISSVAITVARAEEFRPREAEYGLAGLWTMTWSAFVPRALWPEKPKIGDARSYARLYFGTDQNSFAVTPFADLYRCLGPYAVPAGMALFGALLRLLFSALAEGPRVTRAGAALYALLLLNVSYEGFYGTLLPVLVRVGAVAALGLLLAFGVETAAARLRRARVPPPR